MFQTCSATPLRKCYTHIEAAGDPTLDQLSVGLGRRPRELARSTSDAAWSPCGRTFMSDGRDKTHLATDGK